MVLLSCSGTGGGIYAKLANEVARHNCPRASPPTIHRYYNLLRVINKRMIANALIEEISNVKSASRRDSLRLHWGHGLWPSTLVLRSQFIYMRVFRPRGPFTVWRQVDKDIAWRYCWCDHPYQHWD